MAAHSEPSTKNSAASLPRERLAPAGPRARGAGAWIGRGAFALLLLAAAWWGASWLWPLPTPEAEPLGAVPAPPALRDLSPTLAERDERLALLTSSNAFALDREFWKAKPSPEAATAVAGAAEGEVDADGQPLAAAAEARRGRAGDADPWARPRTRQSEVRGEMLKLIKEVDFKGVYRFGGEPVALLGLTKDRPRLHSLRAGDSFADDAWKVVAIDDVNDRVLLARDGQNIEFQLYDPSLVARAEPDSTEPAPVVEEAAVADAPTAGPIVARKSIDDVRLDLERAGLPPDAITELLTLAADESLGEPAPAATEGDAPADAVAQTDAPAETSGAGEPTPAGIGAIMQLMKGNPVAGEKTDRAKAEEPSRRPPSLRERRKKEREEAPQGE